MRFNKETAAEILRDVADELDGLPEAHFNERLPQLLFDIVEALNMLRGLLVNDPIKFDQINAGADILRLRNDLAIIKKLANDSYNKTDAWITKQKS